MSFERVCAILPLKPFDDAKERLATGLDPAARQTLARAMATDVLAALPRCRRIAETVVVSAEPAAAEIAGAAAILRDERTGHSEAASIGARWAAGRGCDAVLMIPGDCPLIDPAEIDALIARAERDAIGFAVVPDRMGTGTNALLISPPEALAPSFGPGSRERHLRLGQEAGLRTEVVEVPSLALDLDTADDLLELAERLGEGGHEAVNTELAVAGLLTDRHRLPGGFAR